MDNMTVSVLLPTRNAEWSLPYALKFISDQSLQPNEILICVGKSNDKTEEIVLNFQKESKTPVSVYYDMNGLGTGYAMNLLLSKATGDIILWADSDSVRSHWWVEANVRYFKENPQLDYLCSHQYETDSKLISKKFEDNGHKYSTITYDNNHLGNPSGVVAFKREVVLKVGGFDQFFTRGQDRDLVIRLIKSGAVGGVENDLQGYHFGVQGKRNLWKAFKTPTFFKFIYKYGWRYCLIDIHHFCGVLLRSVFLFSTVFLIISLLFGLPTLFPSLGVLLSIIALVFGITWSHSTFNFNLFILQVLGSIGEYYQLWVIFKTKDRPKIGYGKKWVS
jgi:glycosyltransferase involved in cell wall biosynthesis